jgi:FemAB-related protein (PEP-CTERM system-associated)
VSGEPIEIRLLDSQGRPSWDAFVRDCPQATFFHLSAWQEIFEEVFDHRSWYLSAQRAGRIIAVLPLAQIKSPLSGNHLSSLPFCAYGGIAGDETARPLLEARAERLARELGVDFTEYRNVVACNEDWPRQDLYATFRKQIEADDEANMLAIPRKQRAMVRKGINNKLQSSIDDGVERFFALYSDNVRRHGTPALPRRLFEVLHDRFGDDCEVLTVSDAGGKPLSSVLSFYFRDEVLPYYAGDDLAARSVAANDWKYWELMRHASRRGCRVFDYGRSKHDTGPWHFKKHWGFEPQPLSYEYRLYNRDSVPQNNPLNPKFRLFVALWKRLPLGVANALGPMIVRHLG